MRGTFCVIHLFLQNKHKNTVENGEYVKVSDEPIAKVAESYPDMRNVSKKERTPVLKQKINDLKIELRNYLNTLKGTTYEFNVNDNTLEAKLYDTGIREVMGKVTQEKGTMLYDSDQIFKNAQYLYSTPDYDGNPDVYRWNYFYTPVEIGNEMVGVRIAVRDMAQMNESQIYNWGIKKDATLGGGGGGNTASHTDASSVASNGTVPQPSDIINQKNIPTAESSVGAAEAGFDPYSHALNEYGAIEAGENPARVVDVPKSVDDKKKVSKFARTAMEASITTDEMVSRIEQLVVDGKLDHIYSYLYIPNDLLQFCNDAVVDLLRVAVHHHGAVWCAAVRAALIGHGLPQVFALVQTDRNMPLMPLEPLRMPQHQHADGIMDDHARNPVHRKVDIRIIVQHGGNCAAKCVFLRQLANHTARHDAPVCCIQSHHGHMYARGKNCGRRLGVCYNIKFRIRRCVAQMHAAAHDQHVFDHRHDLGLLRHRQRNISQRPKGDDLQLSRVCLCHARKERRAVFGVYRQRRVQADRFPKTALPVDIARRAHRPHQRLCTSGQHRNIRTAAKLFHDQRVVHRNVQSHVAAERNDAQYVKFRMRQHQTQRNKIINAGIGTDHDRSFFHGDILLSLRLPQQPVCSNLSQIRHPVNAAVLDKTDSKNAQQLLGHAQLSTTMDIYMDVLDDTLDEAATKMDGAF